MTTRTLDLSHQLDEQLLSVSVPTETLWERLSDKAQNTAGGYLYRLQRTLYCACTT